MTSQKSNYQSASERVKKAGSKEALDKVEVSLMRLYNAGALTVEEFKRLDGMVVDRKVKLDLA